MSRSGIEPSTNLGADTLPTELPRPIKNATEINQSLQEAYTQAICLPFRLDHKGNVNPNSFPRWQLLS